MFLSDLPLTINKERPFQGKIEIVRHCINMNKRIFSLFIPETINFRIIVKRKRIFDLNFLSRGCQTKLKNYGNSGGGGGGGS